MINPVARKLDDVAENDAPALDNRSLNDILGKFAKASKLREGVKASPPDPVIESKPVIASPPALVLANATASSTTPVVATAGVTVTETKTVISTVTIDTCSTAIGATAPQIVTISPPASSVVTENAGGKFF